MTAHPKSPSLRFQLQEGPECPRVKDSATLRAVLGEKAICNVRGTHLSTSQLLETLTSKLGPKHTNMPLVLTPREQNPKRACWGVTEKENHNDVCLALVGDRLSRTRTRSPHPALLAAVVRMVQPPRAFLMVLFSPSFFGCIIHMP